MRPTKKQIQATQKTYVQTKAAYLVAIRQSEEEATRPSDNNDPDTITNEQLDAWCIRCAESAERLGVPALRQAMEEAEEVLLTTNFEFVGKDLPAFARQTLAENWKNPSMRHRYIDLALQFRPGWAG